MKTKLFAGALAALALMSAGVASAQDYRRDGNYRGRAEITVRNDGRTFSFDRRDRMFYRLLDRPFHFRPGLTYAYTDRCNRSGCQVIVFNHRRPIDRIFAPHLPRRFDRDNRYDGRGDRDGRWDDRDDRDRDGDRDWDRDGRGD